MNKSSRAAVITNSLSRLLPASARWDESVGAQNEEIIKQKHKRLLQKWTRVEKKTCYAMQQIHFDLDGRPRVPLQKWPNL